MRLLLESLDFGLETWLTMHEDPRNNPRCNVAFNALLQGLQNYMTG